MSAERDTMATLPFCKGTVVVPRHRRGALAGMALAAPSRPPVARAHRLVAGAVASFGARWLPRAPDLVWPRWIGTEGARALLEDLRGSLDGFDSFALHVPRQPGRRSLALILLRAGRPLAFVKAKLDAAALDLEASTLAALAGASGAPLQVARPLARGTCGVHWLATTVLDGPHQPAFVEPGPEYEVWLDRCLGPVLASVQAPSHWRAAHGDLAPWNLRKRGSAVWLVDWESATLAPPGADRTYFRAARAVVLRATAEAAPQEAVEYWMAKVSARDAGDPLNRHLLEVLPRMATG